MSLKMRLARAGSKKRPYYHIVIAPATAPRDGKFIDVVGSFNPMLGKTDANRVKLDGARAADWLKKGAQPTDRVLRFLDAAGLKKRDARNNPTKGLPGKKRLEREKAAGAAAAAAAEAAVKAAEAAKAAAEAEKAAAAEAAAAAKAVAEAEKAAAAEAAAAAAAAPAVEAAAPAAVAFVDDVSLIDGIGPKITETLAAEGITSLKQIAEMSAEAMAALDEKLALAGRSLRDEWIIQAQELVAGKPPRAKIDQAKVD